VGHNVEPAPYLARAGFERREQARFDCVAQPSEVAENALRAEIDMAFDVFEETPLRLDLCNEAGYLRPQVARIVRAEPLSRKRERLAGIAARHEMNPAAPRAAVETGNIVPDRRVIQRLVRHPRHESGRREAFPLDVTHSPVSGFGNGEAELKPADPGAERDSPDLIMSSGR
jgi:hypothetical protein